MWHDQAGKRQATIAVIVITSNARPKARGSRGLTLYSSFPSSRVTASPAAAPSAIDFVRCPGLYIRPRPRIGRTPIASKWLAETMLPVVTSARSPILRVLPVILLTKSVSNSLHLLCQVEPIRPGDWRASALATCGSAEGKQPLLMGYQRGTDGTIPFHPAEYGSVGTDSQSQA